MIKEIQETIDKLNDQIYQQIEPEQSMLFNSIYDGVTWYIKFGDHLMWNSDDDDREWNEEISEYEDLYLFVVKQFKLYKETINKLKLSNNYENNI